MIRCSELKVQKFKRFTKDSAEYLIRFHSSTFLQIKDYMTQLMVQSIRIFTPGNNKTIKSFAISM